MHIAMFTDSYKPQINGLVTSIDLFTKELERRGHTVTIFAPDVDGGKDAKNVRRIKSVRFVNYKEYMIGLPFSLFLKRGMEKFDIVHVHSPFSIGVTGLGLARIYNIPCVSTFHTLYPEYSHYLIKPASVNNVPEVKKLFEKFSWRYMRWFSNRFDAVIAPSAATKAILEKRGIKDVFMVPTGSSLPPGRKKKRRGSQKMILHVGRITKEKNIEFIIRSLERILRKNAVLVVTSDGPYRAALEELAASLHLEDKIIFTGYLSDSDLAKFYALADVFVMASESETQGLVLLDAANNCLPSVVVDAPVIADFVRETGAGIVSSRRNFAKNVERALSDEDLRKSLITNCVGVRADYSIEKCTDQLLSVYESARKKAYLKFAR